MTKAVDKLKWLSSSVIVVALLTVFWVWPAWNSGPQTWYFGNDGDTISIMYRNMHAPSGHNNSFEVAPRSMFSQDFKANEAAYQMLGFDNSPWQYHLEWYFGNDAMAAGSDRGPDMMGAVEYLLNIGRWDSMTMMWQTYFQASGFSNAMGTPDFPVTINGEATPVAMMSMMSMMYMPFVRGDILTAMLTIMNNTGGEVIVPIAQTCYITSPLSDPGYPGFLPPIPSLSQWGMLALAVIVGFFSFTVIRRRMRTAKS
ncbi:MAG: IPTL-CTERM sorting domain-containing protein [Deltaproteobacteria bacterium]|nr:IPTL-CTERM sorting domain-containing protein [Deltaproteobacteria bacterium]